MKRLSMTCRNSLLPCGCVLSWFILFAATSELPGQEQAKEAQPAATREAAGEDVEAAADEKPAPETPAARNNPLSDLLKQMLAPANRPGRNGRGGRRAKARSDEFAQDETAPVDRMHEEMLARARELGTAGDWRAALELTQRILDDSTDSVVKGRNDTWTSVRLEAQRFLQEAPPAVRQAYQTQFGGLARRLLEEAERANDFQGYAHVASRYFLTDAGFEAANQLAAIHFNRGEFGLAAQWFERLAAAKAPLTNSPAWKLRFAFAAQQAENAEASARLLKSFATDPQLNRVAVGGLQVNSTEWLRSHTDFLKSEPAVLDDWPIVFGTPSRRGTAQGGEPLLMRRWSHPLAQSRPVQQQIAHLLEDTYDEGSTPIPMMQPLMVDGKILFRSLRGVQVIEAQTGRLLWETPDEVSAERLLTGGLNEEGGPYGHQFRQMVVGFGRGMMPRYYSGSAGLHPLSYLLFRNSNYGTISSDGERLFVIEDQIILDNRQPGQSWGEDGSDLDAFGRSRSSNKLVAYNLETGHPVWEAGGPDLDDSFALTLAGHFFLGVPLVEGGELLAVTERNNEIRLFALDPKTGALRWSQLIGHSEADIEDDVGRQWWTASLAVGEGVIVCPTTVGWMVGIDRRTHSILWSQRYAPPKRRNPTNNPGEALVPFVQLDEQWAAAPPVIAGNRVVYSPLEESVLVCLNLYDGTELWKHAREDYRYFAGVFGERVLLVGKTRVTALSLGNGKQLWTLSLNESGRGLRPAGRGVAVGNRYHLPLTSGELWTIDLETGKVVDQAYLPGEVAAESGGLGNLAMYRGMLISLSPQGVTAFEQRDAVVAAIQKRLASNPRDVEGNLRKAELDILNRDYKAALESLHQIDLGALGDATRARYRAQLMDTLQALVRSDLTGHEAEMAELEALVTTPEEKQNFRRLTAERQVARSEFLAAFETYLALAEENRDEFIPLGDAATSRGTVRADLWLAGKLRDLWERLPEDQQTELNPRLAKLAETAMEADIAARERFVTLFGFHQAAWPLEKQLLEHLIAEGKFLEAENRLLAMQNDPQRAAIATLELARLMRSFDRESDSEHFLARLEKEFGTTEVAENRTGAEAARELREASSEKPAPPAPRWSEEELVMSRVGSSYSSYATQELSLRGMGLPFYREHRLQVSPQDQRLALVDVAREEHLWLQPLRARNDQEDEQFTVSSISAHQVVLLHRGVLHCLSPVERRVVWTHALDERFGGGHVNHYAQRQPVQPMRPVERSSLLDRLSRDAALNGPLAAANNQYICYQGRRKLVMLDASTGRIRWTREGIQPGTLVHGSDELLYLVAPNRNTATALRALDGSEVAIDGLIDHFRKALDLRGKDFILAATDSSKNILGLTPKGGVTVRRFDPLTKKDRWQVDFPAKTLSTPLSDQHLAIVTAEGKFQILDLETGNVQGFASGSESELKSRSDLYAVADYDNIYLIVNRRQNRNYYSDGIPSVQVNGTMHVFDPAAGKLRWKQEITSQHLLLDRLDHSPVLVFAARKYERKGNTGFWLTEVLAVDKETGHKLADVSTASQAGFQSLVVNLAEHYVELRSYNERIRLSPQPKTAAAP